MNMTGIRGKLARTYAQAIVRVWPDLTIHEIDAGSKLANFLEQRTIAFYLPLTTIADAIKMRAILAIADHLQAPHDLLVGIMTLISKQHRLVLLSSILRELAALYKQQHRMITVKFISSSAWDMADVAPITRFLEQRTGSVIEPQLLVDPRLIAGIRLQSDTYMWEHSVAQQLRALGLKVNHGN